MNALTRVLFRMEVAGSCFLPRHGPALIAANHQGYLDPFFLQMGTARTIRYMLTSDFYDIPGMTPFFKLLDTIRVNSGGANRDSLRAALDVLAAGEVVGIFPEGRLTVDGTINRIMPGAAFLAARSGAPIVPARIAGSFDVLSKRQKQFRLAVVRICYGPPFTLDTSRREDAVTRIEAAWRALGV